MVTNLQTSTATLGEMKAAPGIQLFSQGETLKSVSEFDELPSDDESENEQEEVVSRGRQTLRSANAVHSDVENKEFSSDVSDEEEDAYQLDNKFQENFDKDGDPSRKTDEFVLQTLILNLVMIPTLIKTS